MTSLQGTPLSIIYRVFFVNNDAELCTRMAMLGLGYTLVVGTYTFFFPAPYGRYQRRIHGPTINAKLGWVIQECMSFVAPLIVIGTCKNEQLQRYPNIVALSLFMIHYFHRSFIYPLITSSQAKPAPLLTVLSAVMFTSYNGFLQGLHLSNVVELEDSFHGLLGTSIFLTGMAINITHDRMLISLRNEGSASQSTSTPNTDEDTPTQKYKIPRGGLFEYVSGANYLGEIIEWMGFAVITREYPQIFFSIFTTVFLGIRALHHHQFYKETFGTSYPTTRKAIIPFIL